jgi:hypothetical protein
VAIGVLTKTFPPELVDAVIDEAKAREQRKRSLPARLDALLASFTADLSPDLFAALSELRPAPEHWIDHPGPDR